jgi:tetratricopeptide (TPR) repeat protein
MPALRKLLFLGFLLISRMMVAQVTTEQLALQYYNSGEFEKAAELYGELFSKNQNTLYYTYYLGALLESRNYREAERLVKGLKETNILRRNFIVELGFVYQSQGDYRKAEKEYERAIESMQPTRNGVVDLANAFLIRRLPEYAVKVYLKGRKVIPEPYKFNIELAGVYQSLRNFSGMMDEYLDLMTADETKLEMVENILQQLIANFGEEDLTQIIRGKIIERSQKSPDNLVYSELLLWYSMQQKDFELALLQAKALEPRIHDEGELVYQVGQIAASNEAFDVAIDAFSYIRQKGEGHYLYMSSEISMLEVQYSKLMQAGEPDKAMAGKMVDEYRQVVDKLGKSAGTIKLIRNLAHLLAFYLDNGDNAIDLLDSAIKIPGLPALIVAECKTDLGDIHLMNDNVWEATLLYSQVEKAFKYDPVGYEAKFRNAKLSFYIGEFDWARTQLDVLRTATSKLIANDAMELSLLISDNLESDSNTVPLSMFARAQMLSFRKKTDLALLVLDSLEKLYPGHNLRDDVLYAKAGIFINRKDYTTADSLLTLLVANYGQDILADNALIMQARMFDYQLKNTARAMDLYEKIILDYPGSVYIAEARKRFKELRGNPFN